MNRMVCAALCLGICLFLVASASATSSYPPPTNIRITYIPELNNEEQVFFCPTDSNIVIANWRDFRLGYRQVGIGRSTDGGQTWTDSLISVDMQYFDTDSRQSDPAMSVDRYGNFYMAVLDYDDVGYSDGSLISIYKSTDKGLTWTGPVTIPSAVTDRDVFEDKELITVDRTGGPYDGNVYCAWARFSETTRIMFARSIDGGLSFEDTLVIDPAPVCDEYAVQAGNFAMPIVSSNGDVHVFWQAIAYEGDPCAYYEAIGHVVSADGGQTFTTRDTIRTAFYGGYANGGIDIYSAPVGEADITGGQFDGNLYITHGNLITDDYINWDSDINFLRSTDNGTTWSEPYRIDDTEDSAAIDAFHPWMVCNEEGVLITIFYDQRYDYPSYLLFDLMAAYSFDGGETFTTNHRISSASSSPYNLASVFYPDYEPAFKTGFDRQTPDMATMAGLMGEYIGVTAYYDKVLAVWTDSRDGNSEVYTAHWFLPLLEPRLASPINGDNVIAPVTLQWSTAWKNHEDEYRVEISDTEDFSGSVTMTVVDTNFYSLSALPFEGANYWRVKAFNASTADSSEYSPVWSFTEGLLLCGDIDGSGVVDPLDVTYFVDWLWNNGPAPIAMEVADVDGSGQVDGMDVAYFVDWLWNNGPDLACW